MTTQSNQPAQNQVFSLSKELVRFRKHLERQAELPIEDLEVNAALLLSDLALFLGFGRPQHDEIVGKQTVGDLDEWSETTISRADFHHVPLLSKRR